MPIYAYKCESCGHRQDVLQKISDPLLTECPACHAQAFAKQVTAAGFQLKGSGWYVTDFRDGNKGGAAKGDSDKPAEKPADKAAAGGADKPADKADAAPAAPSPAPAAASAPAAATPAPAPSAPSAGSK